jgi:hypothetical protein
MFGSLVCFLVCSSWAQRALLDDGLPANWLQFSDADTGLSFYYNSQGQYSQWETPVPGATAL